MEEKKLRRLLKKIGATLLLAGVVVVEVALVHDPSAQDPFAYSKARMSLDSTYSAKKVHLLDSLDAWKEVQTDSLRARYQR